MNPVDPKKGKVQDVWQGDLRQALQKSAPRTPAPFPGEWNKIVAQKASLAGDHRRLPMWSWPVLLTSWSMAGLALSRFPEIKNSPVPHSSFWLQDEPIESFAMGYLP